VIYERPMTNRIRHIC
jgi:hypothetical protein